MPGKWEKLKGKVPFGSVESQEDSKYELLVREKKDGHKDKDLTALIGAYVKVDKQKDELNAQLKDTNAEMEALRRLIVNNMDTAGIMSIRTTHGQTRVSVEPYASVKDKDGFEAHIASVPILDYLWSVHHAALTSLVKDQIERGLAFIDEQGRVMDGSDPEKVLLPGVSVFLKSKVSLSK